MAGFDDLIADALPYLAREEITATQGTTWEWSYSVTDHDDAAVNMTTGFTGSCSIREVGGTVDLVTVTVTFPVSGQIKCKALPTSTDDIAPGNYFHELTIVRTSDSAKIIAVGGGDSQFSVKRKVAP